MTRPLDLLVVPGSIRPRAFSPRVAACIAALFDSEGHRATLFDIAGLPMYGTFARHEAPAIVEEWRERVRGSDGVVWVAPTYHGTMPGVLKNALDLVSAAELRGQVHGVVGVALGNGLPAAQDVAVLLRLLGGRLPMYDLFVGSIDKVWGEGDEPALPDVRDNLARFTHTFARSVALFRPDEAPGRPPA